MQSNNCKISVIIPVYNVEAYLDTCIESVVSQSYRDLEIFLVDDGSTDQCGEICDKWAKLDNRIQVIHKTNGGLSDARNSGLKASSGAYISFVDSDDWLDLDVYQMLFESMLRDNCDISICQVKKVKDGDCPKRDAYDDKTKVLTGEEALKELIEDRISQVVWNKLYKRDVVEDVFFEKGKYHEDVFWSYQVLGRAKKIAVLNYVGYFYRQREQSIMGEKYSLKRLDVIEAKVCRQAYLEEKFPDLVLTGKSDLIFSCMYHGQLALTYLVGSEQCKAFSALKVTVAKIRFDRAEFRKLSTTHRIWIVFAHKSLKFTCKLRNFIRVGL